ncbi:MAG TPA: hypothetical protein VH186_33835 [Chloroflexia bacterium]|nr:hypothetical protein [Chloroflexia bacterium]
MHTRQRRRNFGTPENLLTVVTILEYRQIVQKLLDKEIVHNSVQALSHPLNEIADQCVRELAFLQFAGLLSKCEAIVSGYDALTTDELELKVIGNLLPGQNSAYSDLLNWRKRLWSLRLLERSNSDNDRQIMLGADPARDNYLYQLWLFYEIGELLSQQNRLVEWDHENAKLKFTWGDGDEKREYQLQHDQSIKLLDKKPANSSEYWQYAPGVRPDFYIQRTDRIIIQDNGKLIWHEPGVILDAKYYRPRDSLKAPASPVKRMIADLQLTGERNGALLFAFQQGGVLNLAATPVDDEEENSVIKEKLDNPTIKAQPIYKVIPEPRSSQYIQPDIEVNIWRVRPSLNDVQSVRETLSSLLSQAHSALKDRVEVRCRGIFLDSLSSNGHGELAEVSSLYQRSGEAWPDMLEDLVLCPKPHVAPWRIDLVSLKKDCCQNSHLCHIKGKANIKPPQRLTALDEIKDAIRSASDKNQDEDLVAKAATSQVLVITRRYADLIKPDINQYKAWLRREVGDIFEKTPLLDTEERETLALGGFLREQVEKIGATNYAGPALLFTGVMEELVRKTIYQKTSLKSQPDKDKTLGGILYHRGSVTYELKSNGWWQETITRRQIYPFNYWLDDIKVIRDIRNQAAHEAKIDFVDFEDLIKSFFGDRSSGVGAFTGLLMAWRG